MAAEGEGRGQRKPIYHQNNLNNPKTWMLKHCKFISIGNLEIAT